MTRRETDSVAVLVASFRTFLEAYDTYCPFTRHGQLQYHVETIRLRHRLGSAKAALTDAAFQRSLYRTLGAWGIGSRASRLRDFPDYVAALQAEAAAIEELDGLAIDQPGLDTATVGKKLARLLDVLDAGDAMRLDKAFATIAASGAQGIIVTNDPVFTVNRAKLVQFAASKRLPAVYFFKLFANAGGLMSYGPSLEESWRRAATLVDKILKRAKPADLPIEQSTRFELVLNLKTARALALTIPQSLLLRADQVIE